MTALKLAKRSADSSMNPFVIKDEDMSLLHFRHLVTSPLTCIFCIIHFEKTVD